MPSNKLKAPGSTKREGVWWQRRIAARYHRAVLYLERDEDVKNASGGTSRRSPTPDEQRLPRSELLHRLRTIHRMRRENAKEPAIAKALGLTTSLLKLFCRQYAPEGTGRALDVFFSRGL